MSSGKVSNLELLDVLVVLYSNGSNKFVYMFGKYPWGFWRITRGPRGSRVAFIAEERNDGVREQSKQG